MIIAVRLHGRYSVFIDASVSVRYNRRLELLHMLGVKNGKQ